MPYCHYLVFSNDKDRKLTEKEKLCVNESAECEKCVVFLTHHSFLNPSSRCEACIQVKERRKRK
jgi:hypothetical protein